VEYGPWNHNCSSQKYTCVFSGLTYRKWSVNYLPIVIVLIYSECIPKSVSLFKLQLNLELYGEI
jgi:hypothetical protein